MSSVFKCPGMENPAAFLWPPPPKSPASLLTSKSAKEVLLSEILI